VEIDDFEVVCKGAGSSFLKDGRDCRSRSLSNLAIMACYRLRLPVNLLFESTVACRQVMCVSLGLQ
jgi:hypothetical protein